MVQAFTVILSAVVWVFRFLTGLGSASKGGVLTTILLGSVLFKVIDFLALGFITYSASESFIEYGKEKILQQLISIDSLFAPLIIDFLTTLRFTEALSIVFSALTIALTILGGKWAVSMNKTVRT